MNLVCIQYIFNDTKEGRIHNKIKNQRQFVKIGADS